MEGILAHSLLMICYITNISHWLVNHFESIPITHFAIEFKDFISPIPHTIIGFTV